MAAVARTSLCLSCRTALEPGEACDGCEDGKVVSLKSEAGRAEAIDAAWHETVIPPSTAPPFWQRAAHLLLVALCLGGGIVASAVMARSGDLRGMLLAVAVSVVAAALVLIAPALMDQQKTPAAPVGEKVVRPAGVYRRIEPDEGLRPLVGTLAPHPDEGTGRDVAAELLELQLRSAGEVTLRDAFSVGIAVDLDDGRRVRLAAGRIRIAAERSALEHASRRHIHQRLAEIDPLRGHASGEPIPFERGRMLQLNAGDRVEILGTFDEHWPEETGYREKSAANLVPRERVIVWLRPVRS